MISGQIFIAEIKTKSPHGFQSDYSFEDLFWIAEQSPKVDWIAIHTHPAWNGSLETLMWASSQTDKPILAKGLHWEEGDLGRCAEHGADLVLVVGPCSNSWDSVFGIIYEPLFPNEWTETVPARRLKMPDAPTLETSLPAA